MLFWRYTANFCRVVIDSFNIEVEDLDRHLRESKPPVVLDVREPWEITICALAGSVFIPMGQIQRRTRDIPRDETVVVVCHHGIRSHHVVGWLRRLGYTNAVNLRGGIDAWARRIDPKMAIY
ncbi:MAG: thiosulfate sulfurtransferase [Rhodospirillaceae bacterium]|nr:MAG: thiosulfate sulfurtransferase [Rhodospirillaceae bacterium]